MFQTNYNLPNKVKIGNKYIGPGEPTFFVAEIGGNHNGDYFLAKRTIERAAQAGADAVKLQKRFVTATAARELLERAQTKDQIFGKTYREYREHLELNEEEYTKLKKVAENLGLVFFAAPYDKPSVDFLERIGVGVYKIASQDITHLPLLEYVAKKGKPVILSVGASNWEEADEAVTTILKHNRELIILYCVSIYPAPDEKLNLATLRLLQERYHPLPIGYSGHERDVSPSLLAVAFGAHTVERHFTLDKDLPGPDHATVSLEPEEFGQLVAGARRLQVLVGTPQKQIHPEEEPFRQKHGKSLVSRLAIPAGTVITDETLCCKSPGYGLKPKIWSQVVGKRARVDIPEDTVLTSEHIEL